MAGQKSDREGEITRQVRQKARLGASCFGARTRLRTVRRTTGETAANRRVLEPQIPEFDARARRGPRRERFHGLILADCQPCKRLSDSDQDKTTHPGVSNA
ncbi:hypothetical protein Bbelb_259900 [Branchiostoma belcheri]|nr:hypothetical protein Bbelb_259900 [Branchiostoma belcheri]